MRILYILHQFYPEFGGGTERVALNLARMAQRAGHVVRVLACMVDPARHRGAPTEGLDGAVDTVIDGVPVTLLDRAALPASAEHGFEVDEALASRLTAWLAQQRLDVVHVMHTMRMATAVAAAQRAGLPTVITLTDFFPACLRVNLIDQQDRFCAGPALGQACARKCQTPAWPAAALAARYQHAHGLLAGAAVRVVPSRFVAERYREAFPDLSFHVIGHGVDLLALARGRSAVTPDRPMTLGFIGTLIEAKGLQVLLQALASRPLLPLCLQVAGAFHGPESFQQHLRATMAADARVQWLGPCTAEQVACLLHGIDLLCLPSLVPETFSLVLHEAAAVGVPALVSDLGAPPQVLAAGGGMAVPAGDVPAWADALQRWSEDETLRAAWRRGVRLPLRVEEEAFLYEGLYRAARGATAVA